MVFTFKIHILLLLGIYIFCATTFARVLFDGNPYIGSDEQHAEIRSIAQASIAARASTTVLPPTSTRVPRSLGRRENTTQADIENARLLVETALKDSASINRARLDAPARNIYVSKSSAGSTFQTRDVAELPLITTKLAAAAALVAELDAAALAKNGSLHRDYSEFDTLRNRSGQNGKIQKRQSSSSFWMEEIDHFGSQLNNPDYTVWRNVKHYGAVGDGVTDDTAAINLAISDGNRCGANCESATNKGAIVYFPSGTYLVSTPIISMYNTQLIGNANQFPIIVASQSFLGLGVISSDVYYPNGGGASWYLQTSNFYRQIRYFTIDISRATRGTFDNPIAAIHWQVAQATSLYQINILASTTAGSNQVGIFAENGSGGFMGELAFIGGSYGLKGGNQQFTSQSMSFSNVETAIQLFWDWGWSWKSVFIDSCNVGFNLIALDGVTRGIGSLMLTDSIFADTPKAILVFPPNSAVASGTTGITLDNVAFNNVGAAVVDTSGTVWLSASTTSVDTWTLGNTYFGSSSAAGYTSGTSFVTPRSPLLAVVHEDGSPPPSGLAKYSYLERPRRTYAELSSELFVQMKWFAAGDGISDDTETFQAVFDGLAGYDYVIYIDSGTYIFTDTVTIPSGIKIVGECWPSLMASGANFNDELNPRPLIRVGGVGASPGNVEIQDILFTSTGPTAGLVAVEWNLPMDNTATASAAMWGKFSINADSHVRLGGAIGTNLQLADCPTTNIVTNSTEGAPCKAGSMMFHITTSGSAYLENVWLWTADHDIDDPSNLMVSVYVARGMLVESQGPVWLYGTASEHAVLYQYEFYDAANVYASMIQTESPYYQPSPPPPTPFEASVGIFNGDPVLDCTYSTDEGCDASWALILDSSKNVTIAGSGLYSWFQSYTQDCVANQNCQRAVVSISSNMNSSGIYLFNIITIGSVSMISSPADELSIEIFAGVNTNTNVNPWWSLVTAYLAPDLGTFYRNNHNYYGLGDSFSAGIGAGATYSPDYVNPDPGNDCAKCVGAYPNQMKTRGAGLADARFRFFSCSGGKTDSIISPPGPGKVSQVDLIRADGFTGGVGFSTLSIGGNNVGFSKVLSSCILWVKGDCEERFTRCEQRIAGTGAGVDALLQQNLTTSYRQIIAEMTETEFVLFVTGYAKFFNENTDECDNRKILPFKVPGTTRPLLTKALRKRTNDAVLALNAAIQQAVTTVNAEEVSKGTLRRVKFVDIDDLMEGHRFCDTNSRGTYRWKDDAWFFPPVVGWDRTKPPADDEDDGGELFIDGPTSIRSIDVTTCDDAAEDSGRWGDQFMCGLAQEVALSSSTNDTVQIEDEDEIIIYDQDLDAMWTDWIFRAFHPKTIAYKAIAERIYIWYWVHFW